MSTILVPVDFNPHAAAALRHAVELARETGSRLVVMYADTFEPPVEFTSNQAGAILESLDEARRGTEKALETWSRAIVPADVPLTMEVRAGYPVTEIVAAAEEVDADTIVMGSHGHGAIARLFHGSVASGVKKRTKRKVVIVVG
jgi:nucleotide-binding universal stress UspA family protein